MYYRQVQHNGGVTTVLRKEGVRVGTAGGQRRIYERHTAVSCGLTERVLDISDRDINQPHVHTVVHMVSVRTRAVALIDMRRAAGHAVPRVRLTVTDIHNRVNRIDMIRGQDQACNRVTTERTGLDGVIRAGGGIRLAVPSVNLAFRNSRYRRTDLRIHLRDRDTQYRVTTTRRLDGVVVHIGMVIGLTQELQTTTCTDILTDIRNRYIPDCQVQMINRLRVVRRFLCTIVIARAVGGNAMPLKLLTATDYSHRVDGVNRQNAQVQTCHRVTTQRVGVTQQRVIHTGLRVRMAEPCVGLALCQTVDLHERVHIDDVKRQVYDRIATLRRTKGVSVHTLLRQSLSSPIQPTAAADGTGDERRVGDVRRVQHQSVDDTVALIILGAKQIFVPALNRVVVTTPERGIALTDRPLFLLRAGTVHRDTIDTITSVDLCLVHFLVRALFTNRHLTPDERCSIYRQCTSRFREQVHRQHMYHVQIAQAVARTCYRYGVTHNGVRVQLQLSLAQIQGQGVACTKIVILLCTEVNSSLSTYGC